MLIKLTSKDCIIDLTIPPEIISVEDDNNEQIADENKQALMKQYSEKIAIALAFWFMAQILIEGLKPEVTNEMIKKSWGSLAQAFDKTV